MSENKGQILRESLVYARTKVQDLSHVKNLNLWGSELSDVSIVSLMDNVEIISLSVNHVDTLIDFSHCSNLQELYLRKNNLRDLAEVVFLKDLKKLKLLFLSDNPCSKHRLYKPFILRILPNLVRLDDEEITYRDRQYANSISDPAMEALHQRAHSLLYASGVTNKYIDDREYNDKSQQLNKQHLNRIGKIDDSAVKMEDNSNSDKNMVPMEQYTIQMNMLLQKVTELERRNSKLELEMDQMKKDQMDQLNKASDNLLAEEKYKRDIATIEKRNVQLLRRVELLEERLFKIPDGHLQKEAIEVSNSKTSEEGSESRAGTNVSKKNAIITGKIGNSKHEKQRMSTVSKSNMKNNNIF